MNVQIIYELLTNGSDTKSYTKRFILYQTDFMIFCSISLLELKFLEHSTKL